jgi:8-oxo-dGTP diphosphatase
MSKPLLKVTAAIIVKNDLVFAARKAPGKSLAGYWEFPGGKIEGNETAEACLIRELKEELDIRCEVSAYFATNTHEYDDKIVELQAYIVTWVSGDIRLTDHDDFQWLPVEQLKSLSWAPADVPIVDKLMRQPQVIQG